MARYVSATIKAAGGSAGAFTSGFDRGFTAATAGLPAVKISASARTGNIG